jgi:hypothetical protein
MTVVDPANPTSPWGAEPDSAIVDELERLSAHAAGISNREACLLLSAADRLRSSLDFEPSAPTGPAGPRGGGVGEPASVSAPPPRTASALRHIPCIDAAHIARQREFSSRTFGPGLRVAGLLDHLRKELAEIEADPSDLGEYVDVIILAIDGAWRAGHEPQEIVDAIIAKQARNEARTWPDWRTADPSKAIEHDRSVSA